MSVEIVYEDARWQRLGLQSLAEAALFETTGALNVADGTVEVLACADNRIAVLNAEFREKPAPTNVLSWPEEDLSSAVDGDAPRKPTNGLEGATELGSIAISYDTCAREAAEQCKPLADHVTHLLVHGILHLLGFDHVRDKDATRMEQLEVEILGRMGIPDPY